MRPVRRTLADWERCVNCKVQASGGVIRHLRGCPEYVPADTSRATTVRVSELLARKR